MDGEEERARRVDACDAVVVGAGVVGAAVAARLARQGLQVAVLEAGQVAGGATGRSAGMVLTGLPGYYRWAVQTFGRETARALWELSVEGREELTETAARLGVWMERTGSMALAVTPEEARELQESAELMREDGFEAWFGTTDPLGRGFLAAMRCPNDGLVDAADLTRALLASAPVAVHTGAEVQALEKEGGGVRVWAYRRTVRCDFVVLAVDGYAPLLEPFFSRWLGNGQALLIVAEPPDEQIPPFPCYADYGYEYIRPLSDGRMLVGAWRYPRRPPEGDPPDPDAALRGGLSRFVRRYFPQVEGHVVQRRTGTIGCTPDGLPAVGMLPHLPQVYFAVGLGGWGLSWAFAVAGRVVEMALEGASPGLLDAGRLDRS